MNPEHPYVINAPRRTLAALLVLSAALLASCGGTDGSSEAASRSAATKLVITATDYGFEAPDTIAGGTVEITFTNNAKEPHFAGLAAVGPGKTFADVQAALTAPASSSARSGPPPFEEFAGIATADPGRRSKATINLPAGTYAVFCLVPSPDGVSHPHKGMVKKLTVTTGNAGAAPEPVGPSSPPTSVSASRRR